jgi:hypothetical protein
VTILNQNPNQMATSGASDFWVENEVVILMDITEKNKKLLLLVLHCQFERFWAVSRQVTRQFRRFCTYFKTRVWNN